MVFLNEEAGFLLRRQAGACQNNSGAPVLANSSYGNKLDGDFCYDRLGTNSKALANKRAGFTGAYAARLRRVQIERRGALLTVLERIKCAIPASCPRWQSKPRGQKPYNIRKRYAPLPGAPSTLGRGWPALKTQSSHILRQPNSAFK
jgi:hypothetical protein